jgi:hypothetical protein
MTDADLAKAALWLLSAETLPSNLSKVVLDPPCDRRRRFVGDPEAGTRVDFAEDVGVGAGRVARLQRLVQPNVRTWTAIGHRARDR